VTGRGSHWPVAIVCLLLGGAGANIGLMLVATRDASFSVEPDYYRKAVEWDRTMAQEERNAALGWSASARFGEGIPAGSRLVVRVVDRAGAPIDGARVSVEAFASARASQVARLTLEAEPHGIYAAPAPAGPGGLWEIRLTVTRGDQVFTGVVGVERAGAPIAGGPASQP